MNNKITGAILSDFSGIVIGSQVANELVEAGFCTGITTEEVLPGENGAANTCLLATEVVLEEFYDIFILRKHDKFGKCFPLKEKTGG